MATTQVQKLRGPEHDARTTDNVAQVLNPLAEAVGKTPIMGASPPAWIRPKYSGDFADVTTLQQTAFHRDALGYTHFKLAASSAAGVAASAAVATLDVGYRPSETIRLPATNGTTNAANSITIDTSGVVRTVAAIGAGESVVGYWQFLAVF